MLAPLSGYKTYLAAALGIAGAVAGALDGDMTWSQASAVIVPAVIGAALRHGMSTGAAALLSTVADALAKGADQAGKKSGALLLAAALGSALLLQACASGSNPAPVAAIGNAAQQVARICQAGAPLVSTAAVKKPDPASAAGNLLAYAQASCLADGTVAATLAPNVNPTTPPWLLDVLTGLSTAAQLAPIILPLVGA